jgi:hypothetical protein
MSHFVLVYKLLLLLIDYLDINPRLTIIIRIYTTKIFFYLLALTKNQTNGLNEQTNTRSFY